MSRLYNFFSHNKAFGIKLFLSYILFAIFLISSITIVHLYFSDLQKSTKFKMDATQLAEEKEEIFYKFFEEKKHSVKAISKNPYFSEYIKHGTFKYFSEVMFYTIMEESREYMQMRFLDMDGNEKIRYDRKDIAKAPYRVDKLQNKANRYYFKDFLAIENEKVWVSPLDLNIEFGKVQKPHVPVVRIATALVENQIQKGIFVINVFMDDLLKQITSSQFFDIYLVDKDGNFIIHKDSKYNWTKINKIKYRLEDEFGKRASLLILSAFKKREIYMDKFLVQPLDLDNQKLYLVLTKKNSSIEQINQTDNIMIATILFFSILMSIPFSIFFLKPLNDMYEIISTQRTHLKELAENLEKKVQIETLKNFKKDSLIQNQSKLAELGEMIGNIAHQWRHPLTRLSLLLQNLKAYNSRGKMNDKLFNESLEKSLYQIDFMSTTIDNFTNFYRNDKEKANFKIFDSFDNVIKIVGPVLEHCNIKIEISDENNLELYGNKNEFSQVLMNIIINAKDAFLDNKIGNPLIKVIVTNVKNKTKIEIIDNAGGINSSVINNIFNAYFTTKAAKGTGIGLYLSKVIIEDEMNGKINVRNNEDGAIFTITL